MRRIEELRRAKGLSRYRLAREIGVTEKAVANWERDGIENARYGHMRDLARIFGVPMEGLDSDGKEGRDGPFK